MKKTILAVAAAVTMLAGFTAPSMASDTSPMVLNVDHRDGGWDNGRHGDRHYRDHRGHRSEIVSPRRVSSMLRHRGYRVGDIDLRRGRYYVKARNHRGHRVKIVVDARSGRILDVDRAGRDRRDRRDGWHRTSDGVYLELRTY
ncbi:MAG: PepSY domain-containing protein [Phyllobacterium sp.]